MSTETIHALLREAALHAGGGTAVIDGKRSLTYADLDAESSQVAHALIQHGVAPGDRIGLFLEKSLEAIIGIYGTLKAGATYVPLDDQAPVKRLAYIARDADIRCLVTSSDKAQDWQALRGEGAPLRTLLVAGEDVPDSNGVAMIPWRSLAAFPSRAPELREDPDALAYILYTSGSTGEPKGVMLSHRNCLAFVQWAAREVGVRSEDRLSSHAPLHFDLSTFDLFAAACSAAAVVLVPRQVSVFPIELARFIREQRITVWYSVPSILTQLVLRGKLDVEPLSDLRVVIFAGEVFPVKYLRRLMELVPHARYFNFYGPTETNVCTSYEVRHGEDLGETLPIGKAIAGVQAILLGEDGAAAKQGEVAELLIRGPTVMHGYWGDEVRSARTLHSHNGERVYNTGDLVQERPDGNLLFLGRRDAQIKTRGYRVELGEVEAALNALSAVVECAVVPIPDETFTNRLKAFVVAADPVTAAGLAAACADRLPRYMIPDEFELRSSLPKSSTGKIDRRQLQQSVVGEPQGNVQR